MQLIPALDLLDGNVVRLHKGDYNAVTQYSNNPVKSALKFKDLGFSLIHIVDLSGAKAGKPVHFPIIKDILSEGINIQVGGGIRTFDDIAAYMTLGVQRVILGTQAILNPLFWNNAVKQFGKDRLALSLDIKDGAVAIKGWTHSANQTIYQTLEILDKDSIRNLIVTDVSRDGTLKGINTELYQNLRDNLPGINLIPAGGFTTMDDYRALAGIGIQEAIAGKAIYENESLLKQILEEEKRLCR